MKKVKGSNVPTINPADIKPKIFLRKQIAFSIDLAYNYGVRSNEAFERAKILHFGMSAFMPT